MGAVCARPVDALGARAATQAACACTRARAQPRDPRAHAGSPVAVLRSVESEQMGLNGLSVYPQPLQLIPRLLITDSFLKHPLHSLKIASTSLFNTWNGLIATPFLCREMLTTILCLCTMVTSGVHSTKDPRVKYEFSVGILRANHRNVDVLWDLCRDIVNGGTVLDKCLHLFKNHLLCHEAALS
jgi:hypothetical protein